MLGDYKFQSETAVGTDRRDGKEAHSSSREDVSILTRPRRSSFISLFNVQYTSPESLTNVMCSITQFYKDRRAIIVAILNAYLRAATDYRDTKYCRHEEVSS